MYKKIVFLFIFTAYYLNIYASENPLTNMVNDSVGKAINEASNLGGDGDLKLTLAIIFIIVSAFTGLFVLFKKI